MGIVPRLTNCKENFRQQLYINNMGFNKRYMPPIEVVKQQLEDKGVEEFIEYYTKPDALIGSIESSRFINKVVEEYKITSKNLNNM